MQAQSQQYSFQIVKWFAFMAVVYLVVGTGIGV